MGSSALRYSGAAGRNVRSPLLKLQSDERLVNMVRKGNQGAFEVLVARYHARLLSFCRHMLGSREDAEDVLQEVLTASYNAILADERPINVRPWLYRIARNRCLNHLRRNRAVGVDSMDIHLAEHGATTADKVHEREEFRQLLHDIRDLPETQRTALVLREMDALSYEQIAEAMETTVSSVKSLLVRARVSLTEAAEARLLSCDEVREELAEIAEGMRRKQSPSVRRHVKNCARCEVFQGEMKKSSRALAALAPVGPFALLYKLVFAHAASHSAGSAGIAGAAGAGGAGGAGAAGAGAAGAGAAGTAGVAAGAAGAAGGAGSAGLVTAGVGAVATKAAAGIAAAALVTAGTVAIDHNSTHRHTGPSGSVLVQRSLTAGLQNAIGSSHLGGSVGAGPGLSVAVISSKLATGAPKHITDTAVALTPSKTTATVIHAPQESGPDKTSVASQTPPTQLLNPPLMKLQGAPPEGTTNGANLSSTGGAGLGNAGGPSSNPSAPTTGTSTMPTTGTSTTSTTVTTSTTGSTPTTTSTTVSTATTTNPAVDPTTGTVTAPTGTTTAPTGTTTAPTGTTTAPTDTSTSASTAPTPPSSTTGS